MKYIFRFYSVIILASVFLCLSVGGVFAAEPQMFMTGSLTVLKDNKPVANADVIVFDQSRKTDENGYTDLEHVVSGNHLVKIIQDNKEYDQNVNFISADTTFNLTVSSQPLTLTSTKATDTSSGVLVTNDSATYTNSNIGIFLFTLPVIVLVIASYFFLKYYGDKLFAKINFHKKRFQLMIGFSAVAVVGILFAIQTLLVSDLTKIYEVSNTVKAATVTTLPTPTNVTKVEEDESVLLTWKGLNSYFPTPQSALDQNTQGYLIKWGPLDSNNKFTYTTDKLSQHPAIQIQPLIHNQQYGAQVYTVDYKGNVSTPSSLITFKTDSTRHDQLKAQNTGFFDDFNSSAGPFDELKWNFAVSGCVDGGQAGQFINSQFHAHNQIEDGYCDRGAVASRARAVFDFTGREGTITFDMDGTGRRDDWYLDLHPASYGPYDLSGHVALNADDPNHTGVGNSGPSAPINSVRLISIGDQVLLHRFDDQGWEVDASHYGPQTIGCKRYDNTADLSVCGLPIIKNYRRHWVLKISSDGPGTITVKINVDGKDVLTSTKVPFPDTKANINSVLFSYNTHKSNEPSTLFHWDNFGFDGPAPTTVTHNYIDGLVGTGTSHVSSGPNLPQVTSSSPLTKTIKIPDSLNGATAARLMYTLSMPGYNTYSWSVNDNVTINGTKFPVSNVTDKNINPRFGGYAPTSINPVATFINVPVNTFRTGDNTVVFNFSGAGIINLHAEFDFPKNSVPAYTQPINIYPNMIYEPKNPDVGPALVFNGIGSVFDGNISGGTFIDPTNLVSGSISKPVGPVSGQVPLYLSITNDLTLNAMGVNPGISEYQIIVDRKSIFAEKTFADTYAPTIAAKYMLDTTKLCNGTHEIFAIAFNPNGTASIPDYFQGGTITNGEYNPVFVKTTGGSGNCIALSTPTGSPLNIGPVYPINITTTTTPPPVPTTTIVPTTSSNCSCGTNNMCGNTCGGNSNFSCIREAAIGNIPDAATKNSYCTRSLRSQGDADGDGIIDEIDYFAYVRAVNGGLLSVNINPDFNGDGVVSATDRAIIVAKLK